MEIWSLYTCLTKSIVSLPLLHSSTTETKPVTHLYHLNQDLMDWLWHWNTACSAWKLMKIIKMNNNWSIKENYWRYWGIRRTPMDGWPSGESPVMKSLRSQAGVVVINHTFHLYYNTVVYGLSFSRSQLDWKGFLTAPRFPPSSKTNSFPHFQDLFDNNTLYWRDILDKYYCYYYYYYYYYWSSIVIFPVKFWNS